MLPSSCISQVGQCSYLRLRTKVGGKRLFTCKNLLAYNSPVLDEILSSEKKDKKKDLDLPQKDYEDVVDLLSYIDPRVDYTITEERAMRLLPLAEEYEMDRLKRECEGVVVAAFKAKRKEFRKPGMMPLDEVLQYLQVADKCNCTHLLDITMNEFAANPQTEITKALLERGDLSERVKLMALNKRLQKVNLQLEKEHRERTNVESKLALHTKKLWKR